jgi:hypothetical protein
MLHMTSGEIVNIAVKGYAYKKSKYNKSLPIVFPD